MSNKNDKQFDDADYQNDVTTPENEPSMEVPED